MYLYYTFCVRNCLIFYNTEKLYYQEKKKSGLKAEMS